MSEKTISAYSPKSLLLVSAKNFMIKGSNLSGSQRRIV